jgi:hypothetical protein
MVVSKNAVIVRWIARIMSIVLTLFLLLFFTGYAVDGETITFREIVKNFLFFPIGVFIGYLISWKCEVTGAFISMICLIVFQLTQQGPPLILVFAVPPVLYFLYNFLTKR